MDAYVTKPIRVGDLGRALAEFLGPMPEAQSPSGTGPAPPT